MTNICLNIRVVSLLISRVPPIALLKDGAASTPRAIVAAPFVVRVKLDNEDFARSLPAGAVGEAAIFTDRIRPAHMIRRVILRQTAILNYFNPY